MLQTIFCLKRWPLHKAWFWETAPFFRLLLPLIAGIVLYLDYTKAVTIITFQAAAVISIAGFIAVAFIRGSNSIVKNLSFLFLNVALISLAWILCYQNDIRSNKEWFGNNLDAEAYVARIKGKPAEKERTWKLEVEVINVIQQSKVQEVTGKAFIYVFKDAQFNFGQGDTIILPNKWQRVKNAGNPFEFDYAGYCARNNLYYLQFTGSDDILLCSNGKLADRTWIEQLHEWCVAQLAKYIKSSEVLGLMQAMIAGDEANLDTELRQAYSETGIIHIIAISGSHLTIFFFLIAFLLSWIRNKKYHWLKYIIALPLIWAYVLVAGAPPSAVRAALMFSLLAMGFAFKKSENSLNQLFATAFVLLCVQPMWLFSVGFQLSFLAVLSLILFYKHIYRWVGPTHLITKALWGAIAASIAAELLVAPLVVYYFHLFPLLFIVANVAAYLFAGITLIAGMLLIGLSSITPVASFIGIVTEWLVIHFDRLVFSLQHFNPISFRYLNLEVYELVPLYVVITSLAVVLFKRSKMAVLTGLVGTCLLFGSFCYNEWSVLQQHKFVVYSIGHMNYIEEVIGKYCIVRNGDDTNDIKKDYVLKPAHTGWHASRMNRQSRADSILQIGNNSVLILHSPMTDTGVFKIDYVVVDYSGNPDPETLHRVYQPKKIILGSHITRKMAEKWVDACKKSGVELHATMFDGAFVLDGF